MKTIAWLLKDDKDVVIFVILGNFECGYDDTKLLAKDDMADHHCLRGVVSLISIERNVMMHFLYEHNPLSKFTILEYFNVTILQ